MTSKIVPNKEGNKHENFRGFVPGYVLF